MKNIRPLTVFKGKERVAIGKAIEEMLGERQGQRTDLELVEPVPQVGKKGT